MLIKIILILMVLLGFYALIKIGLWSLGIVKKPEGLDTPKSGVVAISPSKLQYDDKVVKTYKQDFLPICTRDGVKCTGGMSCWNDNKFKVSQCRTMNCECLKCIHGKCPPAQKD